MYYKKPTQMLKAKMTQTAEIDKINNQKVARRVQVYANNEINKVVENKLGTTAYNNGMAYNNPQTLTDLISINKPKIDKEYSKLITDKKTSNTLYHQIQVQRQANEKTVKISQEQYARLQENIDAITKVLNKYEVSLDKYRELNKKYPKTKSRRGIITESITNKNLYTKTGLNIQPNVFGYKEMSALVEAQHRLAQIESDFELAKAQNEEAILKGEEPPNTHKTWIWTGAGKTTRHEWNDGQTVPIDEPFIIENSADGQIDEMMYPLDPNVYSSNGFICYCEVEYHNNQEDENDKALEIMALDSALRSANSLLGEGFEVTDNIPAVPNEDYTGEDITANIKNINMNNEVEVNEHSPLNPNDPFNPKVRKSLNEFAKETRDINDGEKHTFINKDGERVHTSKITRKKNKMETVLDMNLAEELYDKNGQLHIDHNHGNSGKYHTCLSGADCVAIIQTKYIEVWNGQYWEANTERIFKSITAEDGNGSRMSLILKDEFTSNDITKFHEAKDLLIETQEQWLDDCRGRDWIDAKLEEYYEVNGEYPPLDVSRQWTDGEEFAQYLNEQLYSFEKRMEKVQKAFDEANCILYLEWE